MKRTQLTLLLVGAGLMASCAVTVPKELAAAREAYRVALVGPAAKLAPAELHIAGQALALAEHSFKRSEASFQTKDLAYVAQRKTQLAEAKASIALSKEDQSAAKKEYTSAQGKIVEQAKKDLDETQTALAQSEVSTQAAEEKLATEKQARIAADKRAAEALAALAKLGEVKEEPRGTVITLSGSVLFASNQTSLLPEAQQRLNQVAEVLMATAERNVVIEGHTDSQGSSNTNMTLSQGRADSVRAYLVSRGYQSDRIRANGLGEGHPVADNGNPEGRANNRRVEIIIQPQSQTAN